MSASQIASTSQMPAEVPKLVPRVERFNTTTLNIGLRVTLILVVAAAINFYYVILMAWMLLPLLLTGDLV